MWLGVQRESKEYKKYFLNCFIWRACRAKLKERKSLNASVPSLFETICVKKKD